MTYEPDPQIQGLMHGLVNIFINNEDDKKYVKNIPVSLKTSIDISSFNIIGLISRLEQEAERAAHGMGLRCKKKEIFTRRIHEDVAEFYLQFRGSSCGL